MRKRTGDWRDVLSAYALAIDTKMICMGLLATVLSVVVMILAALLYRWCAGADMVPAMVDTTPRAMMQGLMAGQGLAVAAGFFPLLNPFAGGHIVHFILSLLFYAGMLWVFSGAGGVISRLAALRYARGDLPTLAEAQKMVREKRLSYFFAPLLPLAAIVAFTLLNLVGGLVASIPYVGRLLLIFPGFPLLMLTGMVMVFFVVFGVLGFGMMMPAISVGGKDAFEGWSSSFSYILWGFGRLVCYMVIALLIGMISFVFARGVVELLIYLIYQSVQLGFVSGTPWLTYDVTPVGIIIGPAGTGFVRVCSSILMVFIGVLRAIPLAYMIAYFFCAYTIIFLLMRKHVDNVDIDEIYEEEIEDEGIMEEPLPGATEEVPPAEAEPTAEVEEAAETDEEDEGKAESEPEAEEQEEEPEAEEQPQEPAEEAQEESDESADEEPKDEK